jgi:tetratricopeptide (TPR) repeat protein
MGVVYAAYDPELDRKVALKLLRPGVGATSSTGEARTRMLREAQALAKLSHPSVVAIHDVGTVGERVWLAMEFVDGRTLDAWWGEGDRSWAQVLETLLEAGRGLAAAHEAGLLHRDFKPENVMVGHDGRVRVMDFGLARAEGGPDQEFETDKQPVADTGDISRSSNALSQEVTRVGAVMGTPAYMSPEQWRSTDVGPAADQFGFCVALWEALYGERPFRSETAAGLALSITEGKRRPPPAGSRVPGWLRRACERGLSTRAEDRWPSMASLIAALERGRDGIKRRRTLAGGVVVALLAGGAYGTVEVNESLRAAECRSLGTELDAVWNDQARLEITDALLSTGFGFARGSADRVVERLDTWSGAWSLSREEACMRNEVRATWSDDMRRRADLCLDDRRLEFEALVAALADGGKTTARSAVRAATTLTPAKDCAFEAYLRRMPLPSAGHEQAARSIRLHLARASSAELAGLFDRGVEHARRAVDEAEADGFAPLVAQAHLELGDLLTRQGKYEGAERALVTAYETAGKSGAADVAAAAADELATVVGVQQARPREGKVWAIAAQVIVAQLEPEHDGLMTASHFNNVAALESALGEYAEAIVHQERALEILEGHLGTAHTEVAQQLTNLAGVHIDRRTPAEALEPQRRALAILEESLGGDHPDVAASVNNLAVLYDDLEQPDEARKSYLRALKLDRAAYGSEHPEVARRLSNLAQFQLRYGPKDEARALFEEALRIQEASLGSEHPDVAVSLSGLAVTEQELGDPEDGRPMLERALGIYTTAFGEDHPDAARIVASLGGLDEAKGDYESARRRYERALEIREDALEANSAWVGKSALRLGELHWTLSDPAAADPLFQRAVRVYEATKDPPRSEWEQAVMATGYTALALGRPADAIVAAERVLASRLEHDAANYEYLGEARFIMAQGLWEARPEHGQDRERAVTVAMQALLDYRKVDGIEADVAEVEAWLRERKQPVPLATGRRSR